MALRKEQVVFAGAVAVVGLLSWSFAGGSEATRRRTRGDAPELARHVPPPVERATPGPLPRALARDLAAEPTDTRPLQPLEPDEPPRGELAALFPPPEYAPEPRYLGRYLRQRPVATEVPDLFAPPPEPELAEADDLEATAAAPKGPSISSKSLQGLGYADGGKSGGGLPAETPAERAARMESYRALYDWVQLGELEVLFGAIENEDRLGLLDPSRAGEAVLLREFDPRVGRERHAGQGAVPYERARVRALGFAQTPANQLELRRRALGPITRGSYGPALELARDCIRSRNEAPRALTMAEELCRALADFDAADPVPRLALARCYESGFQFERALAEYDVLCQRFEHRPEVHALRAELLARFLLDEQAEAGFRAAIQHDPGSFDARWRFGRFLLSRGRGEEALEHLERAEAAAPTDPWRKIDRVGVRVDRGRALLAAARAGEGRDAFRQALQADAGDARALAGVVDAHVLEQVHAAASFGAVAEKPPKPAPLTEKALEWLVSGSAPAVGSGPDLGFELLLAGGLQALADGQWAAARERLERAAETDPLRANLAWRALSWLAEVTGNGDEAYRYAEMAYEADPEDAWTLYQRGRLLAQRDDDEAAMASFEAALRRDASFDAPLAALGELHYRRGRRAEAERYLDQALRVAPDWREVHALRGWNALQSGEIGAAQASFEAALALDPLDALAAEGQAWCRYRVGQPEEALIQLAQIDDRRRNEPETDPHRVWARAQIARIQDHMDKVLWSDRFERTVLKNRWVADEGAGPLVAVSEGSVKVEGVFKQKGAVKVFQRFNSGSLFVSLEASLWIGRDGYARAGLYVSRERERRGVAEVQDEVRVSRHAEGVTQVRIMRTGDPGAGDSDVVGITFPTERWTRLKLEVGGDPGDPRLAIYVDGVLVREGLAVPGLFRASSEIRAGLFVEGDVGRKAMVRLDDVEVVSRNP